MSDLIEEDFSEVNSTPFVEHYEWGLIGFRFYEGWMEDVRVCAAGLKAREVPEREAAGLPTGVNPAERLQKALISFHGPPPPPAPPKPIQRWSDRLHRFFEFLATGGGSMLTRKDDR